MAQAVNAPEGGSRARRLSKQRWSWVVVAIFAGSGPVIFVAVVIGIASLGNLERAGGPAPRALA